MASLHDHYTDGRTYASDWLEREAAPGNSPATCRGCGSSDVTDPFEMDGYADGEYQAEGLMWIVCRGCGRTTRVEEG
jgi:hypothetical protein